MAESGDAVWPNGAPSVGETAERSRAVEREDIERFTQIMGLFDELYCTFGTPQVWPDEETVKDINDSCC